MVDTPRLTLPNSLGETVEILPPQGFTVLTSYRGHWCPFCQAFLKGLQAQGIGPPVRLLAVSADPPDVSEKLRHKLGLTFPILSDPEVRLIEALGLPWLSKHPHALSYPKKTFLQPAVLMWQPDGQLAFAWRYGKATLWNLFGARNRLAPEEIKARISALA